MKNYSTKNIIGIDFLNLSQQQTLHLIINYVNNTHDDFRNPIYIHTVNTDHIVNSEFDKEFKDFLYNFPKINTCDGFPLYASSIILSSKLPERVTGADLVHDILINQKSSHLKVYVIGGNETTINQAKRNILSKNSECAIIGYSCPSSTELFEEKYIENIKKELKTYNINLLILALGSPKQELWYKNSGIQEELNNLVTIGAGASIDFIAGKVKRAPKLIRDLGLEWAFRLIQEPKRLGKRYFKDLLFLKILVKEIMGGNGKRM